MIDVSAWTRLDPEVPALPTYLQSRLRTEHVGTRKSGCVYVDTCGSGEIITEHVGANVARLPRDRATHERFRVRPEVCVLSLMTHHRTRRGRSTQKPRQAHQEAPRVDPASASFLPSTQETTARFAPPPHPATVRRLFLYSSPLESRPPKPTRDSVPSWLASSYCPEARDWKLTPRLFSPSKYLGRIDPCRAGRRADDYCPRGAGPGGLPDSSDARAAGGDLVVGVGSSEKKERGIEAAVKIE